MQSEYEVGEKYVSQWIRDAKTTQTAKGRGRCSWEAGSSPWEEGSTQRARSESKEG